MKVLFVHPDSPLDPAAGGIGSCIRHRGYVLVGQGIESFWSNGERKARFNVKSNCWEEIPEKFQESPLRKRIGRFWLPWSPLWNWIIYEKIDVVEFADGTTTFWPKKRPFAIGIQCHTSQFVRAFLNRNAPSFSIQQYFHKICASLALRRADALLACSEEILWLTSGFHKVHPDRFSLLPCAYHRSAEPYRISCRLEETTPPFFLVAGNLEYFKGFDLIAKGFLRYRHMGGKAHLVVAGTTGFSDPNPELQRMLRQPSEVSLLQQEGRDVIRFLGRISKRDLAVWRSSATAVVIGSRFDALTMVAGEAFLSSCPVILSNRTGWRSLAERFQAARLVDPYDADDFARAFQEMEQAENRERYRKGGDRLADWLTGPELARATAEWYRRLAGQRGSPRA